jgi:hypothetical protein
VGGDADGFRDGVSGKPCIISLAAACAALRDAPSDTAAHNALLATLPPYAQLQRRLNRALQGDLPQALRRRHQPLAIDFTLSNSQIIFHNKDERDSSTQEGLVLGALSDALKVGEVVESAKLLGPVRVVQLRVCVSTDEVLVRKSESPL